MSQEFLIEAFPRGDQGRGASRRLRREERKIPAIIYGGKKEAVSISIWHNELKKALENEAFFSHILTIELEGKKESVILKDLQRHPYKPLLTHADFLRVDATHEITMNVPLHVVNEEKCVGIKDQGGELHVLANEVAISCLPKDLPDFLEVDISNVELGTTLHLSDLTLPAGVTSVDLSHGEEHDNAILSITKVKVRGGDEEEGEGDAEASAE